MGGWQKWTITMFFSTKYLNHFFLMTSTSWFDTHVNWEHSIRIYLQQELKKIIGQIGFVFLNSKRVVWSHEVWGCEVTKLISGKIWNVYLTKVSQVLHFIEDTSKVVVLLPSLKHKVRPWTSMLGRWVASLFEGTISAHFWKAFAVSFRDQCGNHVKHVPNNPCLAYIYLHVWCMVDFERYM